MIYNYFKLKMGIHFIPKKKKKNSLFLFIFNGFCLLFAGLIFIHIIFRIFRIFNLIQVLLEIQFYIIIEGLI